MLSRNLLCSILASLVLLGCSDTPPTDIELGNAPFTGEPTSTRTITSLGDYAVQKDLFWEGRSNLWGTSPAGRQFLLNLDTLDNGDELASQSWDGQVWLALVTNAWRYAGHSRLTAFRFSSQGIERLFDRSDLAIAGYTCASGLLTYTLEDGTVLQTQLAQ